MITILNSTTIIAQDLDRKYEYIINIIFIDKTVLLYISKPSFIVLGWANAVLDLPQQYNPSYVNIDSGSATKKSM